MHLLCHEFLRSKRCRHRAPPRAAQWVGAALRRACFKEGHLSTLPAMDARSIDDLARRLAAAVPPGLTALRRDLEDNFKAVLQSGLARLDLVSRQEFDVQAAVLRRTREKLEALEARIAALENGEKTPAAKP
jgi:ubiquinone biosynthesis accessory factor UbiK